MKNFLVILILLLVVAACKKKEVDGTVIITVYKDGITVPNPSIYLKKGAVSNASIALSSYDQNVTGNKTGQFTFENLTANDYLFYSRVTIDSTIFSGSAVTKVEKKLAPNRYELKISLN